MAELDQLRRLTPGDYTLAHSYVGLGTDPITGPYLREPDLVIAPEGRPYLYRWHLVPRNSYANVYFHIQVAGDTERHLHDHEYDNQSVILAGGYIEVSQKDPPYSMIARGRFRTGDVIHRKAEEAHRLILPDDVPYSISLFTTGPRRREWGFYVPGGIFGGHLMPSKWVPWHEIVAEGPYRTSVLKEKTNAAD